MRIARPDIHRVIDTREDLEDKWNDGLAPGIVLELLLVVPVKNANQQSLIIFVKEKFNSTPKNLAVFF